MSSKYIDSVIPRYVNIDDESILIFKIVMDLHYYHNILIHGMRDDVPEAKYLLDYYRHISDTTSAINMRIDTVFYNCRDIPYVYSVELDKTIPLIAYPYELYLKNKHLVHSTSERDKKIIRYLEKLNVHINISEYITICRLLELLSDDVKKATSIFYFF